MFIDPIESTGSLVEIGALKFDNINSLDRQGDGFSALISDKLASMNQTIQKSEMLLETYIKGGDVSTHELAISMGKAKLELQLAVEIRNKLLESYQEITRIQL